MGKWANDKLKGMSIEQKIGQLFTAQFYGEYINYNIKQAEFLIKKYNWGGIHFNYFALKTPQQAFKIINKLQSFSDIPLFITADAESGLGGVVILNGATEFPFNMAIGASRSLRDARIAAEITAGEARAIGINLTYSPVVDINTKPENPSVNVRSFSDNSQLVSKMALEFIKGYRKNGLIPCIKHFPGQGDVECDSHLELAILKKDRNALYDNELKPYRAAIEAGVDAIMIGHITVPAFDPGKRIPASLSKNIISGLLRNKLGFDGVVFTDGFSMKAITNNFSLKEAVIMAVNAGADIVSCGYKTDVLKAYKILLEAVKKGAVSEEQINNSVQRVLRLKEKYLMRKDWQASRSLLKIVGSKERLGKAKDIACNSVTIIKDEKKLIPLKLREKEQVLVIEPRGENPWEKAIGIDVPYQISLMDEISQRHSNTKGLCISQELTQYDIKKIHNFSQKADVIIFGLFLDSHCGITGVVLDKKIVDIIKNFAKIKKPMIIISMGSPYFIKEFPEVSTYIAAYSRGIPSVKAVVEILFGEGKAKGLLPVEIPNLYPFGHGIV